MSNPVYPIPVVLTIDSDWASFVVVASDGLVELDPNVTYPKDVYFLGSQLFVGTQLSHKPQYTIIQFQISSDGSPIDIITSHGDESTTPGPGSVSFSINGVTYTNNTDNGDGVNAKAFSRVPVKS